MPESPDPAAIFAAAWSLHEACVSCAKINPNIELSDCYKGGDEFLRQMMRVGDLFERWSCDHIDFNELEDVWPYLLQDGFGEACLKIYHAGSVMCFDSDDCLRVALILRLPVRADGRLPVPVCVETPNPNQGARFIRFRIQTVRECLDDEKSIVAFTEDDEPFDERFGSPFFGVYGVYEDGVLEHITDLKSYENAVKLLASMIPGLSFQTEVVAFNRL